MNGTDASSTCNLCPLPGTTCDTVGTTLETMPLAHGYWRPHNASLDVRPCKDQSAGSRSGCGGGIAPCNASLGLTGIYCQSCIEADAYYADSVCRACGPLLEKFTAALSGAVVGLLALLLAACLLWSRRRVRLQLHALQMRFGGGLWRAVRRLRLTSKLKILWGYYQV